MESTKSLYNFASSQTQNNKSDQNMFESAFSVCSQIPCGLALVLNLYLTKRRVSRDGRVITTLVISTVCFVVTTVLVNVNTEKWTTQFFAVTLASVAIINFCSGIFQVCLTHLSSFCLEVSHFFYKMYVKKGRFSMKKFIVYTISQVAKSFQINLDHSCKLNHQC